MMLDSSLLVRRYLVCDYGQAIVHLHDISIDDFSVEAQGEINCKLPALVSWYVVGRIDSLGT